MRLMRLKTPQKTLKNKLKQNPVFMNRNLLLCALLQLSASLLLADVQTLKWGEWTTWGDQGDGTYRNPVLPSDYSDIDCIRVGADY